MKMILEPGCSYSQYCAAVQTAKKYVEEVGPQDFVIIYIGNSKVNEITYEYDQGWIALECPNIHSLYDRFPYVEEFDWVSDCIKTTENKIKELEARKEEILKIKAKAWRHAAFADDHDDECQEWLEAVWELRDIEDELYMLHMDLECLNED